VDMHITELEPGFVKVSLAGRLDTTGVDRVETRFVGSVVPAGKGTVVDLSRVEFIASLGVRMLISVARSLGRRGARIALCAPQEQVREVFDHVSLAEIIPIYDNEADAFAALKA
jgi:anti-sigma B factor antagonist